MFGNKISIVLLLTSQNFLSLGICRAGARPVPHPGRGRTRRRMILGDARPPICAHSARRTRLPTVNTVSMVHHRDHGRRRAWCRHRMFHPAPALENFSTAGVGEFPRCRHRLIWPVPALRKFLAAGSGQFAQRRHCPRVGHTAGARAPRVAARHVARCDRRLHAHGDAAMVAVAMVLIVIVIAAVVTDLAAAASQKAECHHVTLSPIPRATFSDTPSAAARPLL